MINQKIIEKGKLSIKVDSKVVSHLSIGLYKNFSRAIKELVSNAYDAEATEIKINLDFKSKKLIIKDNGKGMDKIDIENKLLTIGKTTPRTGASIGLGRKRIGQFGVGFLAVFPYCKTIRIVSKKAGEENAIEVIIKVSEYYQDNSWVLNNNIENIDYKICPSLLPKKQGETIVLLENIEDRTITQMKEYEKEGCGSIERFGWLEKTKWELSQYLPLQFPESYKELKDFFYLKNRIPLRVWFDGEELFRNVPEGANNKRSEIIEKGEQKFGNIILKYTILSPFTSIRPQEARGFQIRLNDVGIGLPTDFDVIKLKGRMLGKLNYFTGEIHIVEGLNNDLMLDRDGFYYTEEVSKIYEFFRDKLTKWDHEFQNTAKEDKAIYETLEKLPNQEKIIQDLKSVGIIKFDKTNLRIPKAPIVRKDKKEIVTLSKKISDIASKKGFTIEKKRSIRNIDENPIEIDKEQKKVIIHEEHPSLFEKIRVNNKEFSVKYDQWNITTKIDPICKLDIQKKTVVFNKNHPIFNIALDNTIIMEFVIGFQFIAKEEKISISAMQKIYRLFEKMF
ncbi:MAG: ATP-binding protein [Candidatus Aenigmarchaeota archaeon]|nr:ATP-binding protein [Candidatus Aenigmarchaeota archaeon]